MARIEKEVGGCEIYTSKKNRKIGYLISTCPVKSMVKEEMFAKGIEIAVLHYQSKRTFAIGCCLQKEIDLKKEIAPVLNRLEQKKGQSEEWSGHPDRIGSPRAMGTSLTRAEIIDVIQRSL